MIATSKAGKWRGAVDGPFLRFRGIPYALPLEEVMKWLASPNPSRKAFLLFRSYYPGSL